MDDNRNHDSISLREKYITLMKPSMFAKLVSVQQDELARMTTSIYKCKLAEANYITSLYEHYVVNDLPKTYIN